MKGQQNSQINKTKCDVIFSYLFRGKKNILGDEKSADENFLSGTTICSLHRIRGNFLLFSGNLHFSEDEITWHLNKMLEN